MILKNLFVSLIVQMCIKQCLEKMLYCTYSLTRFISAGILMLGQRKD